MTAPTPPPFQPQPVPPAQKSWFARHKILTVIGALIIVSIIAGIAGGSSSKDTDNASDDNPAVTETTQAPAATKAPTKAPAPKPAGLSYPGKKDGDKAVRPGGSVELSGWTTTIGPLKKKSIEYVGNYLCASILMVNRDDESQRTGEIKMQAPNGQVEDMTFVGTDDSGYEPFQDVAPGGKVQSQVCFDYKKTHGHGLFLVSWQPDTFSSDDRGVWVNRL